MARNGGLEEPRKRQSMLKNSLFNRSAHQAALALNALFKKVIKNFIFMNVLLFHDVILLSKGCNLYWFLAADNYKQRE